MSGNEGGPPSNKKRFGEATFKDERATQAYAERVKRDLAIEKARAGRDRASSETRATVVEGPDGVPQLADLPEDAPATVRWDVEGDAEDEEGAVSVQVDMDEDDEPPPAKRNP